MNNLLLSNKTATPVRVRLCQDDVTKIVTIEVGVQSHMKHGLWANAVGLSPDDPRLAYNVQKNAETLACYLNRMYRDRIEPQSVGHTALAALKDILKQAERASTRKLSITTDEEAGNT